MTDLARRVGLLGGTFDPPHLGHLVVAETVREALDLDEVRFLVAGDPWMKDGESNVDIRLRLVELAIEDNEYFSVDAREARRRGPTFTADTLAELRAEHPQESYVFIVGADAAAQLPNWERVDEAMELATWVVVDRPGAPPVTHRLSERLAPVDAPILEISSSEIREHVRHGRSIRYLVPTSVRAEIDHLGLYRPADD